MLFALWLASCPACVMDLGFPQHLAPGAVLEGGQSWASYTYEYLAYGSYYVGEWGKWNVYAGAVGQHINYAAFICRQPSKDCGLYLGDVYALYGAPDDVHHAWTVCVYDWPGVWVTVNSTIKRGRFGCRNLLKPIRSISFRE